MLVQSVAESSARETFASTEDDDYFAAWRARELSRVERAGLSYLDYTGAALYPESLVRADAFRLSGALLGNPHSEHGPSRASGADVEEARRAILSFLHADPAEYAVVLTANATAACRLVAESFPFSDSSRLVLTADNHNSVNGVREYARARGAALVTIPLDGELRLDEPLRSLGDHPPGPSLLALPAQSNFSGVRHPLDLVAAARQRGYRVLLDAASFIPTADLRLDTITPDFVALSIYKIAGYPSGIGALVARHEALAELRRPSFAGGTVRWVSVQGDRHRLFGGPAAFEDGTVPYLAAGAVAPALGVVEDAGRERLARHLNSLTGELLAGLQQLRHANGVPVAVIHGPRSTTARGATVAFTILDAAARPVPFWEVEEEARISGLALRGGCFCNPGCAERAFDFPGRETAECLDALGDEFTVPRLADCLGHQGVGALRVSFGLGSIRADLVRVLEFVGRHAC
jgi:selenocysteine lyase/cysteine desulfurase